MLGMVRIHDFNPSRTLYSFLSQVQTKFSLNNNFEIEKWNNIAVPFYQISFQIQILVPMNSVHSLAQIMTIKGGFGVERQGEEGTEPPCYPG
jgi:hypothetical protein